MNCVLLYSVAAAFLSSYAQWKRAWQTADAFRAGRPTSPSLTMRYKLDHLHRPPFFSSATVSSCLPAFADGGSLAVFPICCGLLFSSQQFTYSLPPVLGFVYFSTTLLCPRICEHSMKLMALMAVLRLLRIARRLLRSGKWPCSCFLRFRSFLHVTRTCRVVWRPSRQLHVGIPGTFRRNMKSPGPIFSVLSCTRMALCLLLRPSCSCNTFSDGIGAYLKDALPLVSFATRSASFRLSVSGSTP